MYLRSIVTIACLALLVSNAAGAANNGKDAEEQEAVIAWQPLEELQRAADTGDPIAITRLADYYFWGPGEDPRKAVTWYEKAARKGNSHAQFSMGFALYAGFGVAWDPNKAAKWFRKSAEQGHPIAQSELSLLYFGGLGVRKDQKKSYYWARKSAEQGWPVGQLRLGQALWNGRGVSENKREACMWLAISGAPAEEEVLSKCSTEFSEQELANIRADADEWLAMHPQAARREYDCWISQNWLD